MKIKVKSAVPDYAEGRRILKSAAKYLAREQRFKFYVSPHEVPEYFDGGDTDIITQEERPLYDALHICASLSCDRDFSWDNVAATVNWLLDEGEESNLGAKSASARPGMDFDGMPQ